MASSDGVSRSPSRDTPNSVGLPWMRDQPHAESSTWQRTTLTRETCSCPRRDSNSQSQQPRGHWNRQSTSLTITAHSRRKQMPLPERHTSRRTWRAHFIPYLFYKVGSLLLSMLFSLPALCVSTIYHFMCPILTHAYILHGMDLSRIRHAVAKTYRSADHSNGSKGPSGSPVMPSILCHWKKKSHKFSAFGASNCIVLNSGCISDLCSHLLTIKIHYFCRYVDDSTLFWVRTEFGHCCWQTQI